MTENQPVVIGVDVGGTKILIGYAGRDGKIFYSQRYPIDRTTQAATLTCIEGALADFMQAEWPGPAPLAIGVGLVGHTLTTRGIWLNSFNLCINQPVPLAAQLRDSYGIPVVIDNDVHCATLAELRLGAGKEVSDFIFLNVGTGLSAGLVCNGQLVRGAANAAGELGHMVVEPGSDLCRCGRRGCLEIIASGGDILDYVRSRLAAGQTSSLNDLAIKGELTSTDIFRAADAGDALAGEVAARAVNALGIGLTNLANLLNPEKIIYAGGVVDGGWLMQRVGPIVTANALAGARDSLSGFFPSQLSPGQVGVIGAACLAWELIETASRKNNETYSKRKRTKNHG